MSHKRRLIYPEPQEDDDSLDEPKSFTLGHCVVCGAPLYTRDGCAGTGMCGPCATGDADTAGEY